MPSSYHRKIANKIHEICEEQTERFLRVEKDPTPLPIPHPKKKKMIQYRPDVHAITKNGRIHIFEIFDSQMNNDNLIIADIIQSYLVQNVSQIFFIAQTEKDIEHVEELTRVIMDRLADETKGARKKRLNVRFNFAFIEKNEADSKTKLDLVIRSMIG